MDTRYKKRRVISLKYLSMGNKKSFAKGFVVVFGFYYNENLK